MAKRVRVSLDDGATMYTLPGNSAELKREGTELKDTIFGQTFESNFPGLIGWSIDANGLYKGFAGYMAVVKKSGSTTAFTTEAFTLVSGKTYKITDATKNTWNRAVTVNVFDDATPVDPSNIESIDYLHGRVTFTSGYTVAGAITATGAYFPMTAVAGANSFNLTQTANAVDDTTFAIAQANGGYRSFEPGLRTVKISLGGIYNAGNAFEALLASRAECIIEINPEGSSKAVARGWFRPMSTGQSGDVGDLEESSLDFSLAVPDQEDILLAFSWQFSSDVTLSQAIRSCVTAWQDETLIFVDYLPDGETGFEGDAVVTDISLAGGLESMNEFSVKFMGVGAPAVVA